MPKEKTAAELLQEEIAALRASDEDRFARIRRIEALQIPAMDSALNIISQIAESLPALSEAQDGLTDQRQAAVANLVAHADYARTYLAQERERIQAQVDEDSAGTEPPPE